MINRYIRISCSSVYSLKKSNRKRCRREIKQLTASIYRNSIILLNGCFFSSFSEGRRYIRIRRAKTDVEAFIPLHPIAGQILELYNTTDDDRPVFPLPVRDVLWYEVHGMGVALGMKENLSYHMARHSFGTLTLTAGIPIESIARMMGHTNIDSTQVYAQVTDRKISSDMNRLMERR